MPSASPLYGFTARGAPLRRRMVPLALTVLIHLLILLLLLQLAPPPFIKKVQDSLPVTFDITPGPPAPTRNPKTAEKARRAPEGASAPAVSQPVMKPSETPPTPDFPFITLTKDELAAADIGKLPTRKSDQSGSGAGNVGAGQDRGAVSGPGEGPGGEQLYDADWYRRPTNAELATYMPANAPSTGYGLVACKTVENYHVENCQSLGESPLGSGFARAVRQAAWQFLVKPPRIGGRSMVGTWVRIRIDYVEGAVK
ncbi:MAG: hypothetical protein QHC67_03815 [Sphingobium sp.]|uniref:hypothetical protein n=1 Tax=Sphingobium sp. TaxID=1912891 RepID=UPI0029BA1E93|nr:hypothetical protein [Sphingobium sp.]MDX3908926.1 hypothetical protein [Sphingobium sp.]